MSPGLERSVSFDQDLSSWPTQRQIRESASITTWQYDPAIERRRAEVIAIIKQLTRVPTTSSDRDAVSIDTLSAETARAFVQRLPADRAFPKVGPDGEGGLVLLWDGSSARALIAVDGTTLILVRDPGSPQSYHFSPMRFDGDTIPPIIIECLPRR
jgi:hypothetical protein